MCVEGRADLRGDRSGVSTGAVSSRFEHAQDHRLVRERRENLEVDLLLHRLHRDLLHARPVERGDERVAVGAGVNDVRVAEARVQHGDAVDSVEGAFDRGQCILPRLVGARLEVGLVDLHDVGAGGAQLAQLLVHGAGEVHRHRGEIGVVVVLRLLRHRERTRYRDLDRPVGVGAQELHVADHDGLAARDLPTMRGTGFA